jgi:hypothetical protein
MPRLIYVLKNEAMPGLVKIGGLACFGRIDKDLAVFTFLI